MGEVSPRETLKLSLSVSASLLGDSLRLHLLKAAIIVPCVLVSELILCMDFTECFIFGIIPSSFDWFSVVTWILSAKLVHEDGKDTEIETVWDVDDSGRDVMWYVPGDTSGVLTFTLLMFILPSSVTLDRGSNGGGDGGRSICASVIFCTLFSG